MEHWSGSLPARFRRENGAEGQARGLLTRRAMTHASLLLLLVASGCASALEVPVDEDPAAILDRYEALGSGPLPPGSYLVAFNVRPSDPLYDEVVRMDVTDGEVAFAPPWQGLEPYWIRDGVDGLALEHDIAPGRCTSCYVAGWTTADAGVSLQLMGLEGFRLRDSELWYERGRAVAAVQAQIDGAWTARTVSIELLGDEIAPELRLRRSAGPLLPWATLSVEASEPLSSEHLDVRVDGFAQRIAPTTPYALGTPISPTMRDAAWWPLGSTVRIGYEGGAVDGAGNEREPTAWALDVVPRIPTRPIGGTGGLVHWGNVEFDRGEHHRVPGRGGAGFFGMLDLDGTAGSISASISICGPTAERVLCTSTWAPSDGAPRTQQVEMTLDRLPTTEGCFALPQTISLGQSTGELITGTVGAAATFHHPDGTPADEVHVVVHAIWADADFARAGS